MLFGTEAIALLTRCSLSNPPDRSLVRRHNLRRQWSLLLAPRVRLQWPQRLKPSEIIRVCRVRRARPIAFRAIAASRHARSGHTYAPRPGPRPRARPSGVAGSAPIRPVQGAHGTPHRSESASEPLFGLVVGGRPSSASATGPSPASSSAYSSSLTGASSAAAASSSCMAR